MHTTGNGERKPKLCVRRQGYATPDAQMVDECTGIRSERLGENDPSQLDQASRQGSMQGAIVSCGNGLLKDWAYPSKSLVPIFTPKDTNAQQRGPVLRTQGVCRSDH